MKFAITILRHVRYPDIMCREMPRFYRGLPDLAAARPLMLPSLEDARRVKRSLESIPYKMIPEEIRRPDYIIINEESTKIILSCRYYDDSEFDWSKCDCIRNNGTPCKECFVCMRYMIDSDRQLIYNQEIY
jgi:hypothetical protein